MDLEISKNIFRPMSKPTKRWCICSSTDTTGFMISCDKCSNWFHGECMQISESHAKKIKHYYCLECMEKYPSLFIVYKRKYRKKKSNSVNECGKCPACLRNSNCNKCYNCIHKLSCVERICQAAELISTHSLSEDSHDSHTFKGKSYSSLNDEDGEEIYKPRKQVRKYYNENSSSSFSYSEEEDWNRPRKKTVTKLSNSKTSQKTNKKSKNIEPLPKKPTRAKIEHDNIKEFNSFPIPEIIAHNPRQCIGPGCLKAVYDYDTKYCSKECGHRLALKRLEVWLPKSLGITDNTPESLERGLMKLSESAAENADEKRLQKIVEHKHQVETRLIQLEEEHQKLTVTIQQARNFKPSEEQMEAALKMDTKEADQLEQQLCVICCAEIHMRHALRHMERCFQKMEGSTVFCASQKEQIIGTPLFCDTFDPQAKAYCKRLRVVCEHYKEQKLPADTPCGFAMTKSLFDNAIVDFCAAPRSKCTRHFGWERRKRAKIDLERYRNLIRMDELLQEEQKIRRNKAKRFSVLGLLLHSIQDYNQSPQLKKHDQIKKDM